MWLISVPDPCRLCLGPNERARAARDVKDFGGGGSSSMSADGSRYMGAVFVFLGNSSSSRGSASTEEGSVELEEWRALDDDS